MPTINAPSEIINVATRLDAMAEIMPAAAAVIQPVPTRDGKYEYRQLSFAELRADTDRIARGLVAMGVKPGMRLVLMVPPSIDFVTLTFALLKSGATLVLIDPGMGRKANLKLPSRTQPRR